MNALDFCNEIAQMMGYQQADTLAGTQSKELQTIVQASNKVLLNMQGDKEWRELTEQGHLAITAARSHDGLMSVAYGGSTLGTIDAIFTAADVGSMLHVGSTKMTYRIAVFNSTTSVTLDRPWVESSISANEKTIWIGQNTFELPTDFDRMLDTKFYNPIGDNYVALVPPRELNVQRQINGLGLSVGTPIKCSIVGKNTAGTAFNVHFDKCFEAPTDLDFQYQRNHIAIASDDTAIIEYPDKDMLYILDMVKARLDRDNESSQNAGQSAAEALHSRNRTQQNHESGSEPVRMTPSICQSGRRRRR